MALSARSVRRIRKTARPLGDFAVLLGSGRLADTGKTVDSVDSIDSVGNAPSGSARSRIITASDTLRSSQD
jgi:hypothetical protein